MRRFAIFLGLIAFALLAIAVFGYPAFLVSQSLGLDFKFPRVASRVATIALLIGFLLVARRLEVSDRASLGYGLPARRFVAETARAVVLGVLLMLPVLVTMVLLGMRDIREGLAL